MRESSSIIKGIAVLSLLGVVFFMFMGCLDDAVSNEDSVTITLTTFDSLTVNATKQIEGEVEANPAIDESAFSFSISNNGASHFNIAMNDIAAMESIDLNTDLGLKITPLNTVPSGSYTLTLSVTAGTATSSKSVTFGVNNGSTPDLVTVDVTLGSYQSSVGSSLEADEMVVYTTTEAAAISAEIDVWYSNTGDSTDALWSPYHAAAASYAPSGWTTKNQTLMAKVSVNFDAITTQAQIDSIWNTLSLTPADNDWIYGFLVNEVAILQTNNGKNVLLKFVSGGGGLGNSQISLKGTK